MASEAQIAPNPADEALCRNSRCNYYIAGDVLLTKSLFTMFALQSAASNEDKRKQNNEDEDEDDDSKKLTEEDKDLQLARNSCSLCGCNWQQDHVSLDCSECGGYSLTRPCPECDGKCQSVWTRNIASTHDSHRAAWIGECGLASSKAAKAQKSMSEPITVPMSSAPIADAAAGQHNKKKSAALCHPNNLTSSKNSVDDDDNDDDDEEDDDDDYLEDYHDQDVDYLIEVPRRASCASLRGSYDDYSMSPASSIRYAPISRHSQSLQLTPQLSQPHLQSSSQQQLQQPQQASTASSQPQQQQHNSKIFVARVNC